MNRGGIDVMIPTLNEKNHIGRAVENAKQVGRVFVLDSCSTDGTQELARAAGATVLEHRFENYSRQKNWGLENMPFEGEWVFILDADERVTPQLRDELLATAASSPAVNGFFVNRVNIFMGHPIRHGGLYPSWNLRLFRRGKCRYEDRSVHEHMICDGPTGYLKNDMLHVLRETMHGYLAKHIRYADMESDEWVRRTLNAGREQGEDTTAFPPGQRLRLWLRREVSPRIPLRPVVRFLYMYLAQLGFLDGRAGYRMAMLMASYEYMIELLYRDKLLRARQGVK
jgi:glycosyltransferase involved in cell wall biosynthesis